MKILRTVSELREWRRAVPPGQTVGFVHHQPRAQVAHHQADLAAVIGQADREHGGTSGRDGHPAIADKRLPQPRGNKGFGLGQGGAVGDGLDAASGQLRRALLSGIPRLAALPGARNFALAALALTALVHLATMLTGDLMVRRTGRLKAAVDFGQVDELMSGGVAASTTRGSRCQAMPSRDVAYRRYQPTSWTVLG